MRVLFFALALCSPVLANAAAVESPPPASGTTLPSPAERTFEQTLGNGLRIIVREDHRAPVMVSQVWYRIGSSYEPTGRTGVSHVLEHMMFKGTPLLPPGEFSRKIAAYGGEENAFTSHDYTGYYQMMSANNLPLSLELEADRMVNALMPDDEFTKEIEVVKEERRLRTDDNPNALAWERFAAAAYVSSGYHHPIIGWMHDLDTLRAQDARDWYQTWYAPNNATLVVVGDVAHQEVFDLAHRYFGKIPSRTLPPAPRALEVPALGERRLKVNAAAKLPALYIGFNVPGLNTAADPTEVYALQMAAGVLDGGTSARLETALVRGSAVAASASASFDGYSRGDDLFTLSGVPARGHTTAELEAALLEQIEKLKAAPPAAEEMERVKAQLISGLVYQQDSISSQAFTIGALVSIGRDWREVDQALERLQAITPERVQAVAQKYLTPERRTVAELVPQTTRTGHGSQP